MARTTRHIRKRIFVGCEGQSEISFTAWIALICDAESLSVHLDRRDLRGGDTLSLVEKAVKERKKGVAKGGQYRASAILLDADRLPADGRRADDAFQLAIKEGFEMIVLKPCLEGVLMRLHEPNVASQAATPADADHKLRRFWPDYVKPPNAQALKARFCLDDLARLAFRDDDIRRFCEILDPILVRPR